MKREALVAPAKMGIAPRLKQAGRVLRYPAKCNRYAGVRPPSARSLAWQSAHGKRLR